MWHTLFALNIMMSYLGLQLIQQVAAKGAVPPRFLHSTVSKIELGCCKGIVFISDETLVYHNSVHLTKGHMVNFIEQELPVCSYHLVTCSTQG